MRNALFLLLFVGLAIVLSSCEGTPSASIKGEFCGMKDKLIILEEAVPGHSIFIDSVRTDNRGRYSFKYKFEDNTPKFLVVRHKDDYLTLLASPGENITISSVVNLHRNYEVSGSIGSEQIQELSVGAAMTYSKIDSLYKKYHEAVRDEQRREIETQISSIYVAQKKRNIEFLVKNPKSLVSVYALFQFMPNGAPIFTTKDYLYFSMISDSLSNVYPNSPHVRSLVENVNARNRNIEHLRTLTSMARSLPNIQLPDMHGNVRKISEFDDKIVLLSFWSVRGTNSNILNAELKQLYGKYKDQGFEIYQVSLDVDQSAWVNSVIEQNLPWVSVRDEKGSQSVAARTYQIQSIPANYLIKDGEIHGKNLWGAELEDSIYELLKK